MCTVPIAVFMGRTGQRCCEAFKHNTDVILNYEKSLVLCNVREQANVAYIADLIFRYPTRTPCHDHSTQPHSPVVPDCDKGVSWKEVGFGVTKLLSEEDCVQCHDN